MGIINISKANSKKKSSDKDVSMDLSRMKLGSSVEFENIEYEVTAYGEFDWGEGFITQQWELKNNNQKRYLDREKDEEVYWILSERVQIPELDMLYVEIKKNENPPDELELFNSKFLLEESGSGQFCKDGKRPGDECIVWSYTDNIGKETFSLYQWSNDKFSAFKGFFVDENKFKILATGN